MYCLKSLQDTYSKNTCDGAKQKQRTSKQKKKRYKTVSNLLWDSILKCETIEQGISEQSPITKVNKSELKWYLNVSKTHAKLSWKSLTNRAS